MSFYDQFPPKEELLKQYRPKEGDGPAKVNTHIHTPYSFSAFGDISEAVHLAAGEGVMILGINDFYVADGYGEFISRCMDHGVFPLLNIEMIGVSKEDQQADIRVNDPGNPGRIYVSGKGLKHPFELPGSLGHRLSGVIQESNNQVAQMVDLLNDWMEKQEIEISLSVDEMMDRLAHGLLRERHVAKMVRLKLEEKAGDDQEFYALLEKLYDGKSHKARREDIAGMENELRSKLLKSGAPAFVPEDDKAFLPLEEIMKIIRTAGGMPTYPLLLDGAGDQITRFEDGKEQLLEVLDSRGFRSVEFIPLRNDIEVLKEYAEYFYSHGFVVSFGTEHNTSELIPLTVRCKGEVELDQRLEEISFNGAACIAAHQYLVDREGPGYGSDSREELEILGKAIFNYYFMSYNPSFAKN